MNEILFQENIEKWSETSPQKALLLPYLNVNKKKVKADLETLASAKKLFSSLHLKKDDVVFVYGVGKGFFYEAACSWLEKGKRLIFLEDDLEVIYHLFTTELGKKLIFDKNVSLFHFDNINQAKELTLHLRWEFLFKKIKVTALPLYEKTKSETYQELSHRILNDQALHNSLVSEYLDYGAAFFNNFYQNIKLLPGSFLGNSLFGKFKNVPAIICGAGPSLNKHFKSLKEAENKALIFAGGSSFNALKSNGITPHFGAGIDPNSVQVARIKETCKVEVPFFFRNRIHPDALKLIKGPRIYIPGSGGYDISEWYEEKLNIESDQILDEGHNVINFEVEIAKALGCSPIIFVGMDLGFSEMRSYADGIIKNPKVTKEAILKENTEKKENDFDLSAVLKKDIYGKPLYTLWKWIIESEWMGDFAKENKKMLLINATEGGLGFPHIKNMTFKEVSKKYFKKNYDLKKRIDLALKKCTMPQVTKKKVNALTEELQESLKRCISYLKGLIDEIETMKEKIKGLKKIEYGFNIVSGRAALLESDLFEEDAYRAVLAIFSEAFSGVLNHETKNIRLGALSEKKKALKRLELNAKRLAFLLTVAEVNLNLPCFTEKR